MHDDRDGGGGPLSRRDLLRWLGSATAAGAGGLIAFASNDARAIGDSSLFRWTQLRYPGRWNPRETGPVRLIWEITKRTSVECDTKVHPVALDDERALSRSPFLFLNGLGALPAFTNDHVRALRNWIARGGFLFIENADGRDGSPFDDSVRKLLARVLPGEPLRVASADHVLYRSFYLLNQPFGRTVYKPYVEVIDRDDRSAVVYSQNDACGAWCRDGAGNWEHEVVPGGAQQRELAFRFGVNVALYALCGNYKRDQVHVQYLLKRRRF
jgi:hypothetical protein